MDRVNGLAIQRYWETSMGGQESEREAMLCCRVWRENELKVCGGHSIVESMSGHLLYKLHVKTTWVN